MSPQDVLDLLDDYDDYRVLVCLGNFPVDVDIDGLITELAWREHPTPIGLKVRLDHDRSELILEKA
jgi:hypothetical protein